MSLQIETAQNVGVDYEVASIGDRILAQFLDYAVRLVWVLAIFAIAAIFSMRQMNDNWVIIGLVMLPMMSYSLLCEYFLDGQTVGKMVLKIKVIKLDGSKATLSSYLLRWLLSIIDVSIFSGLIAIITIAINGKGQRLGDIAAGTTVVKTQPTVKLEHIITADLAANYQPTYDGVTILTDKDIRTLRKVLATNNDKLMDEAMSKIEDILGVNSLEPATVFLSTVVNDYNFYANVEER